MLPPFLIATHSHQIIFLLYLNLSWGAVLLPSSIPSLSPPVATATKNLTLPLPSILSAPPCCKIPHSPYLIRISSISPIVPNHPFTYPILSITSTQHEILHSAQLYCQDKIDITGQGRDLAVEEWELPFVSWRRGYGVRIRNMDWRPATPPRETKGLRPLDKANTRSKRKEGVDVRGNVPTPTGSVLSSSPLLPATTTGGTMVNITTSENSTSSVDAQRSMLLSGNSLQGQLTWAAIWYAMEGLRICVVDATASSGEGGGARENVKAELWENGGLGPLAHVEMYRGSGSPI